MNLHELTTEERNEKSSHLDQMTTLEMITLMNEEDKLVAHAVEDVLPEVAVAIENIYKAFTEGGRLFYVGAGTSGRLGIVDASECPPTFLTSTELVQSVMAGGEKAFLTAVEGAEDNEVQGGEDLKLRSLNMNDVVVGITSSGRTPYPIGALKYARSVGAYTVSLTCNKASEISIFADCSIEVIVGPEVLSGSTRMKSATAHKMILNMMSTAAMVKMGKVYENLMVDLHASNYKLVERAKRTIMEITNVSYEEAERILSLANNEVKPSLVMIESEVTYEEAIRAIEVSDGFVREAIKLAKMAKSRINESS